MEVTTGVKAAKRLEIVLCVEKGMLSCAEGEKRLDWPFQIFRFTVASAAGLMGISKNPNFVAMRCCSKNFIPYISGICCGLKFFSRLASLRILNF